MDAASHFAVIREKIPLTNDNKHVVAFKSTYDRLFHDFHATLLKEYNTMKEGYICDYQANYQSNLNEKQANIDQFEQTISDKKDTMTELETKKGQDISCL